MPVALRELVQEDDLARDLVAGEVFFTWAFSSSSVAFLPCSSTTKAIRRSTKDFGQRLRAFVVLEQGKNATEDELKAHVKKNLARYKVPREIVFLDELPRNATGKILKRELKDEEEPATK